MPSCSFLAMHAMHFAVQGLTAAKFPSVRPFPGQAAAARKMHLSRRLHRFPLMVRESTSSRSPLRRALCTAMRQPHPPVAHRALQCSAHAKPSTDGSASVVTDKLSEIPEHIQGQSIRQRFLEFFETREHLRMPSGSLVPEDPTVLLTIAGMLPFKPVFLGQAVRPARRVTTTQKCVRTNDIENVGVTKRHHTFFEMLGNFSFGDYFKREAIEWAWELSTKEYKLDPERVWVSVFREDDEAYNIWRDVVGVKPDHIQRLDEADNFWSSGPTGPCGPCSELYYDFKPEQGSEGANLAEDDDRFIEFYNLVFMESNRGADGEVTPLENKNIDTGMGLERMAQILQGAPNNYETDLIFPIISKAAELAGVDYSTCSEKVQTYLKVIGDHTRAVVYLVSDGVNPSNVGRGYVVRRLLRRVVRCGRLIGIDSNQPFTPKVAQVAVDLSGRCDPAVVDNAKRILAELEREELRFVQTLERGDALLEAMLEKSVLSNAGLAGRDAFTLYDTYGFPIEITQEVAAERGVVVDMDGFRAAMEEQRLQSQAAAGSVDLTTGNILAEVANRVEKTQFVGYDRLLSAAVVSAIVDQDGVTETAMAGARVQVILNETPFYAESGGQVGDHGMLLSDQGAVLEVVDVAPAAGGRLSVHTALVRDGTLRVGDTVNAKVDAELRRRTRCNHTATHLLQSALKAVLGQDTSQAGSLVGPERLRFDFNSPRGMTQEELETVEKMLNAWIGESHDVVVQEMSLADAKSAGATAMFGEKYSDVVRVVDVPNVSMELCGGTHVTNLAEIRGFRIVSETGIASGVRRIEAVSGDGIIELLARRDSVVKSISSSLKVKPDEIGDRIEKMQMEIRAGQKQISDLKSELALAKSAMLANEAAVTPSGAKVVVKQLDGVDSKSLQVAAEQLVESMGDPSAVVLGSGVGTDKVALVAAFSPAVVKAGLNAGSIIGASAKICGGGGGGRPNLAQAGGKDPASIPKALELARGKIFEGLAE
mmetsp:Transcript_19966/g.38269  ORF Transcript_19966/g.38269 Transcript_19966/m.38269 type:complete len:992 (-) Transcript_19966:268-3243(-)